MRGLRFVALAGTVAIGLAVLAVAPAAADPPPRQISVDSITGGPGQHATQVEPDTFSFGRTVVAAFQNGRNFPGSSAAIGVSVSHNGGHSWRFRSYLPFLTVFAAPTGPFVAASDPSVAYDARHHRWLISTLVTGGGMPGTGLAISASNDDGESWLPPVAIAPPADGSDYDKNWIVCDNSTRSPFYGHCYGTWDDFGHADTLLSNVSTDGGRTWSTPATTADHALGIGGQPLVQPNGTVVVPADNIAENGLLAYRSTDGGNSWGPTTTISPVFWHVVAGGLRAGTLPSAEIDASGTVYVAWPDCRFRPGCTANDILVSRSADGLHWSAPRRVPIDPVGGTVDHFIPGLGVDPTTSGGAAHLGLTYYSYPRADCSPTTCLLDVGFISSSDGGASWSAPRRLNHASMQLSWLAETSQGRMVGDYISTSFSNGKAVGVFALATPPDSGFHESMFAMVGNV
jgi:hypothetical protein